MSSEAIDATPAQAAPASGLLRILGVGFGLAVIVGSTLGIGILRTPGLVAGQLTSTWSILAVWLLGGLYTLLGCACLIELGTALPEAGGYYVYVRRAFGPSAGFAVGWSDWLTYCAVLGYVSIAIGEFAVLLVPSRPGASTLIAAGVLAFLAGLQLAGVRISSRFQEATTAVKFLAFLALVAACLIHAWAAPVVGPAAPAPPLSLTGLVIAVQAVVITYGGWQSALYFTEEDRDPNRNLPRSMIGGVVAVIAIYLLVNLALLSVLPLQELARSTLPAADAARVIVGAQGQRLITLLSIISLPPMLNAILMIGTRILFAMGRDGLLWRRTAAVNARGTPAVATLVTTGVALALIASGTFQKLIAVASVFLTANYCACCLALFALRRQEPQLHRPFRAWGYPWSAAIVLFGAAAFLVGVLFADKEPALLALSLLAAGLLGRMLLTRSAR
jgi:APA family basic amino acid/polyamine antiporter